MKRLERHVGGSRRQSRTQSPECTAHPDLAGVAIAAAAWLVRHAPVTAFLVATACGSGEMSGASNNGGALIRTADSTSSDDGFDDFFFEDEGAGSGAGTSLDGDLSSGTSSPECASIRINARVDSVSAQMEVRGNVLFVFDQSSSMRETWSTNPKWKTANDALVAAFTPLQDRLRAGSLLFPCPGASSTAERCSLLNARECLASGASGSSINASTGCPEVAPITSAPQMKIQPGAEFLSAWRSYWTSGDSVLQTGTPTELALLRAEAALATPPVGDTVVVLLTDGQPNCGSNESAVAARLLTQKKIKTFVVGLPGAREGTTVLDAIAKAGGTAPQGCVSSCFLSPANPTDLQTVLANIASTTVSTRTVTTLRNCQFTLDPQDGANPTDVHLIVTSATDGQRYEIPQQSTNGWTLSADHRTGSLQGKVCEDAINGKFTDLTFQYGCVVAPSLEVK